MITAPAAERAQVAGDAIVLTSAGDTMSGPVTPMARDKGHKDKEHAKKKSDGHCIAMDKVLVGPVCVNVEIITVTLKDVLTA